VHHTCEAIGAILSATDSVCTLQVHSNLRSNKHKFVIKNLYISYLIHSFSFCGEGS